MCWSGRKDLNLRPLRPERSALPGCATPRPGGVFRKGVAIVLHQRVETQAVRLCHAAAGHLALSRFTPFANPASARTAASTPEAAKVKRYGKVALVNA